MTADKGKFKLVDFLHFMLSAVERIKEDTDGVLKAEFLGDTKSGRQLRDAVVLNLGTIGEIAGDIRNHHPEFAAGNPDFPIARVSAMRNQLFHGYHSINYEIVWSTCQATVPELERWLRAAIARLGEMEADNGTDQPDRRS